LIHVDYIKKLKNAGSPSRILDVQIYRDFCMPHGSELRDASRQAPRYTADIDAAFGFQRWVMTQAGQPLFEFHIRLIPHAPTFFCVAEITVPSREFQGRAAGEGAEARARMIAAIRALDELGYAQKGKVAS
jgi:hypothetical protein